MPEPRVRPLFALCLVLALFGGLGVRGAAAPDSDAPPNVLIAYQPGIGYANLIVMKERGVLEKQFPGTKFEWKVLSNGATIRDGIIAGQIAIGAGGIGPFLIGWERGVGYRLIASLNQMDLWLVARDKNLKTLKDFKPDMKIAMPGPDAIQAIALRKGAEIQLGNAHALDANIIALQHPLALQSLAGGQVAAHFGSPPFQFEEVAAGGHIVLKSYDVMGKSTFNSVYTTEKFFNEHPKFIAQFYRDLLDTTHFTKAHAKEASELLSRDAEGKNSPEEFRRWITRQDVVYSTTPRGFLKYAQYMQAIGMLKKIPSSMRDIELPILGGAGD